MAGAGSLLAALSFLTRVPVDRQPSEGERARAVLWFPLVGAGIGAVVGGVQAIVAPLVNPLTGAALAVAVGALLTGGFHEDGLGDTADGFGGGWTVEQRLSIMDDSRQGTYGVLAIACSVIIRVAALSALTGWLAVLGMAAVHLAARSWAVAALTTARPARADGLAHAARSAVGRGGGGPGPVVVASTLVAGAVAAGAGLGPVPFGAVAATGLATTAGMVALAYRKVNGVTGDVLGAVEQLAETLGAVALAATATRGWW